MLLTKILTKFTIGPKERIMTNIKHKMELLGVKDRYEVCVCVEGVGWGQTVTFFIRNGIL